MLHWLKPSSIEYPQKGHNVTLWKSRLPVLLSSVDNCNIMREHLADDICCDLSLCSTSSKVLAQYLHQILFHFTVNVGSEAYTFLVGVVILYSLHLL